MWKIGKNADVAILAKNTFLPLLKKTLYKKVSVLSSGKKKKTTTIQFSQQQKHFCTLYGLIWGFALENAEVTMLERQGQALNF